MNRILILEGYVNPFGGSRRTSTRSKPMKRMQSMMKKCALKWKRSGKRGKYTAFMRKCLKGRK